MVKTYSVQEVSELLNISKSTLYRNVANGQAAALRPIRVGQVVRFPRAWIDQLCDGVHGSHANIGGA